MSTLAKFASGGGGRGSSGGLRSSVVPSRSSVKDGERAKKEGPFIHRSSIYTFRNSGSEAVAAIAKRTLEEVNWGGVKDSDRASIISSIAGHQHSYILEFHKACYPVATKWITTSEAAACIRNHPLDQSTEPLPPLTTEWLDQHVTALLARKVVPHSFETTYLEIWKEKPSGAESDMTKIWRTVVGHCVRMEMRRIFWPWANQYDGDTGRIYEPTSWNETHPDGLTDVPERKLPSTEQPEHPRAPHRDHAQWYGIDSNITSIPDENGEYDFIDINWSNLNVPSRTERSTQSFTAFPASLGPLPRMPRSHSRAKASTPPLHSHTSDAVRLRPTRRSSFNNQTASSSSSYTEPSASSYSSTHPLSFHPQLASPSTFNQTASSSSTQTKPSAPSLSSRIHHTSDYPPPPEEEDEDSDDWDFQQSSFAQNKLAGRRDRRIVGSDEEEVGSMEEEEDDDVQPESQKMPVGTKRGREASGVEQTGATGHIRLKVRKDFQAMDSDPEDEPLTSGSGTGVGG